MKIIDLSVSLEANPSELPEVKVVHGKHEDGAEFQAQLFECSRDNFPGGLGAAVDLVRLSSHAGTHIDAPWHYGPTSEGKKARTVEQLPVEWFFSDGVVLDMRHKTNGDAISTKDLQAALAKISYTLKPLDIVLIQTGADKYWGNKGYFDMGCGLVRESTLWLLEQGVKVIGIDAFSLDRPAWAQKEDFKRTGRKEVIWEAHYAGIDKEFSQIEKLRNLDKLPEPKGFKISCFPIKLAGASGAWCRTVAIYE
ncbi:cyclase family protein [Chloroflexota bacterium]